MVNKLLLARDKFMPEMPLREPGFTLSVCGPFLKTKKENKKLKKKEIDHKFFKTN